MDIRRKIPWWMKIIIKLIISRFGINYSFWQKIKLFRHGKMDESDYARSVFDAHITRAGITANDLRDKTILELGPGDSIATAFLASSYGARTILLDTDFAAIRDIRIYQRLANDLNNKGIIVPDISTAKSLTEILNILNAKYLTEGLSSFSEIPADSVDLIFSQAVLEHIKKNEFLETICETYRILRPNGIASHVIDLKDHLGYALNNLRFQENIWDSDFMTRSGFYTNRIRYTEMIKLFKQAAFKVNITEVQRWDELPTPRYKMAKPFQSLSLEELLISEFHVVLRL